MAPDPDAPPPFRVGRVTTDILRQVAEEARIAAEGESAGAMAFTLGRIAEWAHTAANAADAADEARDG